MPSTLLRTIALFSLVVSAYVPTFASEQPAAPELTAEERKFFETHIRPLLVKRCVDCHGPDEQSSNLRLDLRASAIERGGDSGPAIEPGKPDHSLLMEAVRWESFEMPPEEQLPAEEIALLERWIKMGAPWPADDPEQLATLQDGPISEEDKAYWAFQTPVRADVPETDSDWPKQPVDHFILRKLNEAKLQPSKPADKRTLARRLYFDVIGLPPSQAEIEEFVQDTRPDAYERLVDKLLASPQYGEHIARHWLDLVRYAESDGYRQDAYRSTAWRYRDYVIRAMNEDKPYDEFVLEQIAGDEYAPEDPDAITATGFLRHGVYEYNQRDVRTHWQEIVNEMTDVTGDVFLGLGMGCARCHNHKFDPILQEDYFALQAFLAPVFWDDQRPIATPEEIAEYEKQYAVWEEKTADIRKEIEEIEKPHLDKLAKAQTEMFPADIQVMMRKPVAERKPLEHQLAELAYLQVIDRMKRFKSTSLKGDTAERYKELQEELKKFASLKPKSLPTGMTVRDVSETAPKVTLKTRREAREVEPHYLTVLEEDQPQIIPPQQGETTGRRLTLAKWLTRPDHPLTARVMVNRIWQQHFGVGLVESASDFGTLGTPPSHPELLDWLAVDFVENGWSMKRIHRHLLLSATYRQSSLLDDNANAAQAMMVDPQNRLLWRMSSERLNADQIRDSILAATGELRTHLGGSSESANGTRRSIYTKVIRNSQHPFFTAFDAPRGTSSTSERNVTVTSTQALLLMNGEWMLKRAEKLTKSTLEGIPASTSDKNLERVLDKLYGSVLSRKPRADERAALIGYIRSTLDQQPNGKQDADLLAWDEMPGTGQTAMNLNQASTSPRPFTDQPVLAGMNEFTIEATVLSRSMYPDASVRTIASRWNNNNKNPGWSLGVTSARSSYKPRNLILQLIGQTASGKVEYEVVPSNIHLDLDTPYYVAVSFKLDDPSEAGITFYAKKLNSDEPVQIAHAKHRVLRGMFDPDTPLVIGGRYGQSGHRWDGLIDQVRISGSRLSQPELQLTQKHPGPTTVVDWNFESADSRLADQTGLGPELTVGTPGADHPLYGPVSDVAHTLLNCNEFIYVD